MPHPVPLYWKWYHRLWGSQLHTGRLRQWALTQVFRDELVTAVHDEDTPHIQLNVVLLLLVLKEVKRGTARDEKQGPELQLPFHGEVL